jgi:hypothetical protein
MEFDAVSRRTPGGAATRCCAECRAASAADRATRVRLARAVLRDPFPTHPAELADPALTPNPEHQDD